MSPKGKKEIYDEVSNFLDCELEDHIRDLLVDIKKYLEEDMCLTCKGKGMVGGYYMSMGEPCDNIDYCPECKGSGVKPNIEKYKQTVYES